MNKWYNSVGRESDVAVSTRVRLARNLVNYPFPGRMNAKQRSEVNNAVKDALLGSNSSIAGSFAYIEMDQLSEMQALSLAERHIVSPQFAKHRKGRALLLMDDESVSIMLNEEDHLRIQVMKPGLALRETLELAERVDALLNESLNFAYDEQFGYLTECPSNLGTGMRASVMLHLPALEAAGTIPSLASAMAKIGMTVRGTYGEGSSAEGAFYQISNQVTLGISETATADNLKALADQIASQERAEREKLNATPALEDRVCRAYGVLSSARMMSNSEFIKLISWVRLGISMGIIDNVDMPVIYSLLSDVQSATLIASANCELSDADIKKMRADIIRQRLE